MIFENWQSNEYGFLKSSSFDSRLNEMLLHNKTIFTITTTRLIMFLLLGNLFNCDDDENYENKAYPDDNEYAQDPEVPTVNLIITFIFLTVIHQGFVFSFLCFSLILISTYQVHVLPSICHPTTHHHISLKTTTLTSKQTKAVS